MDHLYGSDYAVLVALMVVTASVGIYQGFRKKASGSGKMQEYALAGGKMAVLPVAFSLSATVISGSSMVGAVGEVYLFSGTEYLCFGIGAAFGLVLSGILVVPVYKKINYVSVYEYLERRFDRWMRLFFSAVYILAKTLFISVTLYVPALSLSTLTSIPQWVSVLVSGAICILYCVIGGMRAVIWTDVLQAFLMLGCNMLIIGFGLHNTGGFTRAWELAVEGGRVGHLTWTEDVKTRYSMWSITLGSAVIFMNAMCAGQAGVQRILSVRSLKEARKATFLGAGMVMIFISIVVMVGLVLFSNYSGCDPLLRTKTTGVRTHDQIMVYAIGDLLGGYSGLRGMALAGIFSGSLSTFSSYINSFATLTVEDFVPEKFKSVGDTRKLLLCRIFTLIYGCLAVLMAFLVPHLGGIIHTSALITGATGGPLMGVILLGMFTRKASRKGVMIGLILGLALTCWIGFGSRLQEHKPQQHHLPQSIGDCPNQVTNSSSADSNSGQDEGLVSNRQDILMRFYNLSFMWYGPIGLVTTLFIGYLASLVFSDQLQAYDERLYFNMGKGIGPVFKEVEHKAEIDEERKKDSPEQERGNKEKEKMILSTDM